MTPRLHPEPPSMRPMCIGRMEQEHMDEVMRGVQGASEETQADRFHRLSVDRNDGDIDRSANFFAWQEECEDYRGKSD